MTPAEQKKLDGAEDRADREKDKRTRLVERGMFVGGVLSGAALSAYVDLKLKPIFGIQPSAFIGVLLVVAVGMDWVPRKSEDQAMAIGLGMLAPKVAERTKIAMLSSGMFGG